MSKPAPSLLDPIDAWLLITLAGPLFLVLAWMRFQLVHALGLPLVEVVELMRAHLFGYLGTLLLCTAWLAAARGARWAFLARTSILLMFGAYTFVELASSTLYHTSHTVLDASLLVYAIGNLKEMLTVLATVQNPLPWTVGILGMIGALALALKIAERVSPPSTNEVHTRSALALLGAGLLCLGLSAWMPTPRTVQRSLGRAVPTNLLLTTFTQRFEGLPDLPPDWSQPTLVPRPGRHPNLVVIGLESTRAASVTAYVPDVPTTPKIKQLAQDSLLVENAYTNFGHTTKAWVSIWCGIHPNPSMQVYESEPGGIPVPCLPQLLAPHGYNSVFFLSATERFENTRQLTINLGFDAFFSAEQLDTKGYERANYFGWEDKILLPPSDAWLSQHEDQPFVAFYMTGTPHHDYLAPTRYGRHAFSADPTANLYLNSVRYIDHFVDELIEQYKRRGLYENTVFILVGDHGEGLGEHFKKYHNDCLYEECVRVPFIVHGPGVVPGRSRHRADQLDIVPTALDALGFDTRGFEGQSLLHPSVGHTTFISCWYDRKCIASVRDGKKLVHFFDDIPDALYDLQQDPTEEQDLHQQQATYDTERRAELLDWYLNTKGRYQAFRETL